MNFVGAASLLQALAFAADKHRQQRRKDPETTPYINHPIAVAAALAIEGEVTDRATLLCAVLHDTVEDTNTTFEELAQHFGADVADLVRELTDDKSLEKSERKRLQVEHAKASTARAKEVKIADKICNIRDVVGRPPANWPIQRRIEYLRWSEKVVDGCRGTNSRLDRVFDEAIRLGRKEMNAHG